MSTNADTILKDIENVNNYITNLNNMTTKAIGRKEEIEKQIEKSLRGYEEKYGVKLDIQDRASIENEYNTIKTEKEKEVEKMTKVFELLSQNKYTEVYGLLGVSRESEKANTGLTPEQIKNINQEFKIEEPVIESNLNSQKVDKVTQEEPIAPIVEETKQAKETPVLTFEEPKTQAKSGMPALPVGFSFEEPITMGNSSQSGDFKIPDFKGLVKGTKFEK